MLCLVFLVSRDGCVALPRGAMGLSAACGPRGGTLIFSHIRWLGLFFGFKILNFNILGGFQKNEYFWGVKILWIFFFGGGVITKLG